MQKRIVDGSEATAAMTNVSKEKEIKFMKAAYQKLYSASKALVNVNVKTEEFDTIDAFDNFYTNFRSSIEMITSTVNKDSELCRKYRKPEEKLYYTINGTGPFNWIRLARNDEIHSQPSEMTKVFSFTLYQLNKKKDYGSQSAPLGVLVNSTDKIEKIRKENLTQGISKLYCTIRVYFQHKGRKINAYQHCLRSLNALYKVFEKWENITGTVGLYEEIKNGIKKNINAMNKMDFCTCDLVITKDSIESAVITEMFPDTLHSKRVEHLSDSPVLSKFNSIDELFTWFTISKFAITEMYGESLDELLSETIILNKDKTYSVDLFNSSIKTTYFRKNFEIASLVKRGGVDAVVTFRSANYYDFKASEQDVIYSFTCVTSKKYYVYNFRKSRINDKEYIKEIMRTQKHDVNIVTPIIEAFGLEDDVLSEYTSYFPET